MIYELPAGKASAQDIDFSGAVIIPSVQVEGSRFIPMGRNYGGTGILGYKVASFKSAGSGGGSSGGNKKRPVDHEGRNGAKNRKRLRG